MHEDGVGSVEPREDRGGGFGREERLCGWGDELDERGGDGFVLGPGVLRFGAGLLVVGVGWGELREEKEELAAGERLRVGGVADYVHGGGFFGLRLFLGVVGDWCFVLKGA